MAEGLAHGCEPFVLDALAGGLKQTPTTPRARDLASRRMSLTAHHLATLSELRLLSEALERAHIGAALAATPDAVLVLEGIQGSRLSRGALLVAPADAERAREIFEREGFARRPPSSSGGCGCASRGRAPVCLDTEVSTAGDAAAFPVAAVLARAVPSSVGGVTLRALTKEDRLLALCGRASAEGWTRLDAVAAVAAVMMQGCDVAVAAAAARAVGAQRLVATAAFLVHDILGLDTPFLRDARWNLPARRAARQARSALDATSDRVRRPERDVSDRERAAPAPGTAPAAGAPRRVILRQFQSPGDIVVLTAAVRELHQQHPGRIVTDVRTACPDLWRHNPYLTPIADGDPSAAVIDCEYPLIHRSNQAPVHFLSGFVEFLNERLQVHTEVTSFKGDLHLSDAERASASLVCRLTGVDAPFWILAAGGKYDFTAKWWSAPRYQEVVRRLRGRVLFVQVGEDGHHHPPLEGVLDLRGRTTLRDLVLLTHHASGVVTPVSLAMHLAAAVETRAGRPSPRPCVVIAGGREPVHWSAYPGHQWLHTIGALECCASGGCWRSRTLPLRDGDAKDDAGSLCRDVVDGLQRCMDLITPDDVVRRIEYYLSTGAVPPLTPDEAARLDRVLSGPGAAPSGRGATLPIWCAPCPPPPRRERPTVTICIAISGNDRDRLARLLASLAAHPARDRFRTAVGAASLDDETRAGLYAGRQSGDVDRIHESPEPVGRQTMAGRLLADVDTPLVWWLDEDSTVPSAEALDRCIAASTGAGTPMAGCEGGWFGGLQAFARTPCEQWPARARAGAEAPAAPGARLDVGDQDAAFSEPLRDGVLLAERLARLRPRRVLLSFRHGLGDLLMFLAPLGALRARYPEIAFVLGVPQGLTYEAILDPASTLALDDAELAHPERLPFDLVVKLGFPMSEHQTEYTKAEWCCLKELGIPPASGHARLQDTPNRLVAVHFHTTCLPDAGGADAATAERIWDDILAAGFVPLDTHFEHVFHHPGNRKFDFVDASVRRVRPDVATLVGLIRACGAFVGVVSGNFHVALSVLPPRRIMLLERDFRRESFTRLPIATASLREYRGEVRGWLESLRD